MLPRAADCAMPPAHREANARPPDALLQCSAGKPDLRLAELFQGKRPRIPRIDVGATFRTAAREKAETQGRLL